MDNDLLEQIRAALRERIQEVSLRGTAREVGMSPTGLRGVVDGAQPYVKTWASLLEWFAQMEDNPPPLDAREAHRYLLGLTRHLPAERLHATIQRLAAVLREAGEG